MNYKLVHMLLVLTFYSPLTLAGDFCGSRSSMLNRFSKAYIVPDFWPPEKLTPLFFAVTGQVCRPLGNARLYHRCEKHDACYELVGYSQEKCDRELLNEWLDACDRAYELDWYEYFYLAGGTKIVCQSHCRADVYEMSVILGIFGADAKQDAVKNTKKKAMISLVNSGGNI